MDVLPPKSSKALKREATISRKGRSQPANLRDCVSNMQNWPTPRAGNPGSRPNMKGGKILAEEVKKWPTPTANTSKNTSQGINWKKRLEKRHLDGVIKATEGNSQLNPDWAEWLMGWSISWSSIEPIKKLMWLDWNTDPADDNKIPRVATNIKDRANRLKTIGNGICPQTMLWAWRILFNEIKR